MALLQPQALHRPLLPPTARRGLHKRTSHGALRVIFGLLSSAGSWQVGNRYVTRTPFTGWAVGLGPDEVSGTLGPFPKGSDTSITTRMATEGTERQTYGRARHRAKRDLPEERFTSPPLTAAASLGTQPRVSLVLCDQRDRGRAWRAGTRPVSRYNRGRPFLYRLSAGGHSAASLRKEH